jgi:ketosteroid isomerase-like protein
MRAAPEPAGHSSVSPRLVVAAAIALVTGCPESPGPPASAEADLRRAIATYDSAWTAKDTAIVASLLDPKYLYFTSSGRLSDRAASLDFLADTSFSLTRYQRADVEVTIAGSVARISSHWEGEGRFQGEAVLDDQTCGQTWLWERGRWLLFTEHCVNRPRPDANASTDSTGAP